MTIILFLFFLHYFHFLFVFFVHIFISFYLLSSVGYMIQAVESKNISSFIFLVS